jgi:hypothetical protein
LPKAALESEPIGRGGVRISHGPVPSDESTIGFEPEPTATVPVVVWTTADSVPSSGKVDSGGTCDESSDDEPHATHTGSTRRSRPDLTLNIPESKARDIPLNTTKRSVRRALIADALAAFGPVPT